MSLARVSSSVGAEWLKQSVQGAPVSIPLTSSGLCRSVPPTALSSLPVSSVPRSDPYSVSQFSLNLMLPDSPALRPECSVLLELTRGIRKKWHSGISEPRDDGNFPGYLLSLALALPSCSLKKLVGYNLVRIRCIRLS